NAKNSKADNIELELSEEGGMLRIVIRDNGSQNNTTERVPFLSVLQAGSDSGSTMLFVVNMLTAVRSVGGNIRVVTYEDAAFTREVIIDLPFINEREEFENDNGEEVKVDDIQAALRAIAQEIKEEALFSSPDFEDVQIAVLEGKNKIDNEFRYRLTLLNEALREYVLASIENAWAQTISIDFAVSEGGILEVRVVSDEKGIIYINQRNMVLGVKGKDVGRRLIDLRDRFREVGGDIVGELIGVNNVYTFRLPVTLVDKRVNQSVYVQPSHIINKLEQGKPNWLLRILLSFWVVPHELGNLALTMFVHSWRKNLQFNLKDIFAGLRYNNVAPSCIGGTVVNLMLGLFLALLFPGSLTALVLGLSQMIFAVIEMRMSETPPDVKAVNADIERIKKDYLDLHYARMDLAKINLIIEDEFNEFIKLVRSRIYWIATVFSVTEVLILLRYLDVLYSGAIGFVTFVLLTKLFKLRAFSNVRKMYKNEIAGYRSVIKNFKYSEQYILSAGVKDYNKEGETEHLSIVRIAGKNLVRVLIGSGPYDLTQGIFINIAEHSSRTRIVSFWRLWLDEKNIVNIERAGQFIVERTNVSFHFAGVRIVVERVGDVLLVNDGGKFVQVEYVNMWGDKNQGTAKFNIPIDWHSIESESMFNVAKRDDLNKAIAARFKKLGAMLKVLEDYLRKMQRTRGSPVVAERIGEDIVWHLTEQQITSILSSADHSQEDIAFLIDQIKIHEAEPTEEAAINAQIESLVITEINEIDNPIRKMDDYESLIQLLGKIAKTSQGMELLRDICIETQIFKMRTVAIDALIEIGNRIEVDKIKELFFELLEECGHPYSIKRLLVFIINNYGKSAIQQLEDIRQRSDDDNKQKTIKLALFNLENMKPEVEDAEDSFTDFVGRIDNSRPEKRQRLQILDVATGAAGFVREIQRHFWGRNARITAIDGSQGMVENALVLSFIEVLFMNWGKMEFTDESFDLITYNFPSPNAGLGSVAVAFKEIFRVCRYGGGLAFYSTEDEFNGFNSVQIIGKLEKSGFERKNINIYRGDQIPASYPRAGTSAQITKPHEAKQIYLILVRKPAREVVRIAQITEKNRTERKGFVNNLDKDAEETILDIVKSKTYRPIQEFDRLVAHRINIFARFFYITGKPTRVPPAFVWARKFRGQLQIFLSRKAKKLLESLFTLEELPIVYGSIARHEYTEIFKNKTHRKAVKEQRRVKDYDLVRDCLELMQILLEQGYPAETISDLVARFERVIDDIDLRALRDGLDIKDPDSVNSSVCLLAERVRNAYLVKGFTNIKRLTRCLVSCLDKNVYSSIDSSKINVRKKREIKNILSACTSKTQLAHVLLMLLGVSVKSINCPGHLLNAVQVPDGKTIFVDVSLIRLLCLSVKTFYKKSGKFLILSDKQRIKQEDLLKIKIELAGSKTVSRDLTPNEKLNLSYDIIQIGDGHLITAAILSNIGQVYTDVGLRKEALGSYKRSKTFNPYDAKLRFNFAVYYINLRLFDQAMNEFEEAIALCPTLTSLYEAMAYLFFSLGDHDKAYECFQKGIKRNPTCDYLLQQMGKMLVGLDRLAEAAEAFRSAIRQNGYSASHYFNLGSVYFHQGRQQLAVRYWAKAVQLNPAYTSFIEHHVKEEVFQYQAKMQDDQHNATEYFETKEKQELNDQDQKMYLFNVDPKNTPINRKKSKAKGNRKSIAALLEQHKDEVVGLSITAASKVLGVSRKGLSRFVNLNSWAIDQYQLEVGAMPLVKVNIRQALIEHAEAIRGQNIYQIMNIIGCSGQGLRDFLRENPEEEIAFGIVRDEEPEAYIENALEEHAREIKGRTVGEVAVIIDSSSSGLHGYLERHPEAITRYGMINIGADRTNSNYYIPAQRQHRIDRESKQNTDSEREQDKRSKGYYGDVTEQDLNVFLSNITAGVWSLELIKAFNSFNTQVEGMEVEFYVLDYGANAPPANSPYIFAIEKNG
ncbi:MAG: methyltransferase domain-containing protein, partial [Candidatus Omnitrophica bacterium]|nr:methyltransferase domain-containing protein [Candidatus Omnitrophota bacterium]